MLESLANAGPGADPVAELPAHLPVPEGDPRPIGMRGDYANLTAIVDLTLSRIDQGFFTGTRWECDLTELELQWGRTIGQFPSPCTAGGPAPRATRWSLRTAWTRGPDMRLTRQIMIQLAIFAVIATHGAGNHGLGVHASCRPCCSASAATR